MVPVHKKGDKQILKIYQPILLLPIPIVKTTTYGFNSVTFCVIRDWNKLQNKLNPELASPDLSGHKFLKTI